MRDYVAIIGQDVHIPGQTTLSKRIIEISACQNFVQAVEIAILCINDAGIGERIIEVREVEEVESVYSDADAVARRDLVEKLNRSISFED